MTDAELEERFAEWVRSLSVLDQELLKQHALDTTPPDKVTDLLRFGPVRYPGWLESDPPRYFYPPPLLRALGITRPPPAT